MKKILLSLLCWLIAFVGLISLIIAIAIDLLVIFFDYLDPPKESIWKGKIDTSWYSSSQTEFTITTAEQLAGFAKLVNDSIDDFKNKTINLGANINLKKKTWMPIGVGRYNKQFKGYFNGRGFVVSGLYIRGDVAWHGLFGHNRGTIKNLGITNSYVEGDWGIGGLAGYNDDDGNIDNCYFSGTARLYREYVGGLVGVNEGSIINSYSAGEVAMVETSAKYRRNFGGLVGQNGEGGTIINSYSTSIVAGEEGVGGLVGGNIGSIINSYSTGAVNGRAYVGGLVGHSRGTILNSYYDKWTSGQSHYGKGEGKTTAEMKQKSTYKGWDFGTVWGISGEVNGGYPYLLNYNKSLP